MHAYWWSSISSRAGCVYQVTLACMSPPAPHDEVTVLRDALDHIGRVAMASRQPTKRLDWIAARACEAARGLRWSGEYLPEPSKQSARQMNELRATLIMLVQACETESLPVILAAVEKTRERLPSVFPT